MKDSKVSLFAATAPGLESVCAAEIRALGGEEVAAVAGGVAFAGRLRQIYQSNLWLRSASRVVVRLGEVQARDFPGLFRKAARLPWGSFVRPGTPVQVRAVSRQSRLQHTGRIAQTISEAVDRSLGRAVAPAGDRRQLILARFEEDRCQLSVDTSGELLHRRGYREATGHAPLRETLGAGMLLRLGWDGKTPLYDPMCGSGTFPIEAALLAAGRPPGAGRRFAFMDWPGYRAGLWQALLVEARPQERPLAVAIGGSDRDPLALAAARSNAQRAGVADLLHLGQAELSTLSPPAGPGLVICNPPYGERLAGGDDLPALYRRIGDGLRRAFAGWQGALICPEGELVEAAGLGWRRLERFSNGGIQVGLYAGDLPG